MINVRVIKVRGRWTEEEDYVTDEPKVREYSFKLYEDFQTWAKREGWDYAYWSCSDPVDNAHAWQSRYYDVWYSKPWTQCEESLFFLTNEVSYRLQAFYCGPTTGGPPFMGMHTRYARRKWARDLGTHSESYSSLS